LATWDVFRSDRLEIERALSTEAVRAALLRGDLHDDDLIRPAGTKAPWTRLADLPAPAGPTPAAPAPTGDEADNLGDATFPEDLEPLEDEDEDRIGVERASAGRLDLSSAEVLTWNESGDEDRADGPELEPEPGLGPEPEPDPLDEDEDAAEFTLSRSGPETVEELDLAAMVDIAFQLVLFFLVTATTVLYKSLEVPKPNPESAAAGATQGKANTLKDLKNDYILVEIDPQGVMKIDREPVASEMSALVERLRAARETTGRKAMLLSADSTTPHRNAVLAYDAANEIGLGIAIARPASSK
jgi:biopolymer transport protein ExbD